jgi:hypothetical protein
MAWLAEEEREAFDALSRALHPRALHPRASEFTPGAAVPPWFYAITANEVRAVARACPWCALFVGSCTSPARAGARGEVHPR